MLVTNFIPVISEKTEPQAVTCGAEVPFATQTKGFRQHLQMEQFSSSVSFKYGCHKDDISKVFFDEGLGRGALG